MGRQGGEETQVPIYSFPVAQGNNLSKIGLTISLPVLSHCQCGFGQIY